ncbi:tyrosine recombinase XerC [Corynebacterium diphtheriae]|uniref:tyrosine-type recombinase/integrase n=1 Tax=Corynebacterium diphtheriae TaxID=1717 RepID=UPI000B4AEF97|nr:site-specific integrase [Corynebacterium diphtheriae]OWN41397.1 hypothetical protein AY488_04960 [Corynebacterium belfantii]OWN26117.1 hypothetical protein AY486_00710 [Corynebacterium diphtheriae bv. mitis]CAB0683682.1 tyrosine recombinase XerC [Corynebacterium diphtheriae]CAB0683729.1 tyrosine recombinase XerC [Corynebacterium diphtheriae]CAB0739668.1 tyrosine recombinase XerC [Corynebacterium diphtheriae]
MTRGRPATPLGTWGEINHTKLPNGNTQASTYLRLFNGKTVRVRATAKSKTAATNKLKQNCQTRLNTQDTTKLASTSKLTELLTYWLENHECSHNTKAVYASTINGYITPTLGNIRLNELTPLILDQTIQAMPPATGRRARTILTTALATATRYGLLHTNPARETRTVKPGTRKPARALTAKELNAYRHLIQHYQNSSPTGRPRAEILLNIVDVLIGTGARISEVLALTWNDINLETTPPTATIRPTKDGGKSTRYTQLPNLTVAALQRQRLLSPPAYFTYVFRTGTAGNHMNKSNLERYFREVRTAWKHWDGIDGYKPDLSWVTPHTFRRTMATLLAGTLGEDIASRQLGHADTSTTRAHYIESVREGMPVVDVVDQFTQGQEPEPKTEPDKNRK